METYHADQINELSVQQTADGTLVLTVVPMLETLYSCPGALVRETDEAVLVGLVRCRIETQCPVDVAAQPDTDNPGSYKITLPDTGKPIKLDDPSGPVKLWPRE